MTSYILCALFAFFSLPVFAASPSFAVDVSSGSFNSSGVVSSATPYTFAPSAAANGDLTAVRSTPVSIKTPYGSGQGTLKTTGIVAKAVGISLAKSLSKLALPVVVGSALYDAYQAAGIALDANGQPVSTPFISSDGSSECAVIQSNLGGSSYFGAGAVFSVLDLGGGSVACQWQALNFGVLSAKETYAYVTTPPPSSGVPVPSSPAQLDAAIDSFSQTPSNLNRLVDSAQSAGVGFPNLPLSPVQDPFEIASPWQRTGSSSSASGTSVVDSRAVMRTLDGWSPSGLDNEPIPMQQTIEKRTTAPDGSVSYNSDTTIINSPSVQVAPPAIDFPTDYAREATNQQISDKLNVTEKPVISSEDADIQGLTGDWNLIPTFSRSGLNGTVALPSESSCIPFSFTLAGQPFNLDPCPMINGLHPLSNYLFVMLFGILTLRTLFRNDELKG